MQFDGEKPDKITRGASGCNDDKVIFEKPLNWTTRSKLNRRKGTLPVRRHRSSVLRRSAHALSPKLPQMMVQMLIHQRRPFLRSQRPEKEVRMPRACPRPARCKAVNEFS